MDILRTNEMRKVFYKNMSTDITEIEYKEFEPTMFADAHIYIGIHFAKKRYQKDDIDPYDASSKLFFFVKDKMNCINSESMVLLPQPVLCDMHYEVSVHLHKEDATEENLNKILDFIKSNILK